MTITLTPIDGDQTIKTNWPLINTNDQILADGINANAEQIEAISSDANAMIGVYKVQDAVNTDDYIATYVDLVLFDGLRLNLEVYNQNTGAVTVDLNSLGAKDVVNVIDNVESALTAGDLVGIAELQFDTARDKFQIIGLKSSVSDPQVTINKNNIDILRTGPTVGGTADAIVLTSATAATFDFTKDMNQTTFEASATNTGAMTVNFDGHGVVALQKPDGVGGYTAMVAGDITIGTPITIFRKVSGNFFLLAPKVSGGATIESRQNGEVIWNTVTTQRDITISAIDPSKSVILVSVHGNNTPQRAAIAAEIINATTIRFTKFANNDTFEKVRWTVVEFNNVKSKQTGIYTPTSGGVDQNIAISAINKENSLMFASYTLSTTTDFFRVGLNAYDILTNTLIRFTANLGNAAAMYWQVIEFN